MKTRMLLTAALVMVLVAGGFTVASVSSPVVAAPVSASSPAAKVPAACKGKKGAALAKCKTKAAKVKAAKAAKPKPVEVDDGTIINTPMPVISPAPTGSFLLSGIWDGGTPVYYSPCEPIAYRVNPTNMPAGAAADIEWAFAEVARVSGYRFLNAGTTKSSLLNNVFEPYAARSLIEIQFASAAAVKNGLLWGTDTSAGEFIPDTLPVWYSNGVIARPGRGTIIVVTDRYRVGDSMSRGTILHEIGHALGLSHVSDPSQLMHYTGNPSNTLADGDITALQYLASLPCYKPLPYWG